MHLILNGLVGLLLGWVAFPAILVGLILQALLFQFGGFTTLGVNGLLMALPAVACFYAFSAGVKSDRKALVVLCSFLCGFGAVFLGCLVLATALALSGEQFLPVSKLVVAVHIPVMVIEGLITTLCIQFVKRVKPEILEGVYEP